MDERHEHCCDWARKAIGLQVDGELPPADAGSLDEHLRACAECRNEMAAVTALVSELKSVAVGVASDASAKPPTTLWSAIEDSLDGTTDARRPSQRKPVASRVLHLLRRPLAAAASLAFLVGAGVFIGTWLSAPSAQVARAGTVDYSILLDNLGQGVDAAVDRFLTYYRATPTDPAAAHANAAHLSFNLPPELPGGYRLQDCHMLDFGNMQGVAACYRRGDEPLFVFFHPPVNKQLLGMHRESHCAVAGGSGHCVEVDGWRLIHFTDPTTCHCLLSRLRDGPEMEAVLAALAPQFGQYQGAATRPAAD